MGSKIGATTADQLAIELMLWLGEQPEAEGLTTLKEALYKLGLDTVEIPMEYADDNSIR